MSFAGSAAAEEMHHHHHHRTAWDMKKARNLAIAWLSGLLWTSLDAELVPTMRLELIRPKSLPPQDSVSTNFTTSAILHSDGWAQTRETTTQR